MDWYDGDDRVRQIACLRRMAADIAFGSDDPTVPASDRVAYYRQCAEECDELPRWFGEHDEKLLVRFVREVE